MASATARTLTIAAAFAAAIGGGFALFAPADLQTPAASRRPAWKEVAWPFAIDQWGEGRAFRCRAADCGAEVHLYVRPKAGFCNCSTGVADDEELDRVGDLELVGRESTALGPGRPIAVHWMNGRARTYAMRSGRAERAAVSIAFNDRCDVVVATLVAAGQPDPHEDAALAFLRGDVVRRWMEKALGI